MRKGGQFVFMNPLVLWGTCISLGCSLCDPEKLLSVCGLREKLRIFFSGSLGGPDITGVSSQIMLWRQLPCCLSIILTFLADLQPGLRNIYIKQGCTWICSHATVPTVSSLTVRYFSIWRENINKRNTLLGAFTFGVVSANCSWWCFRLCCDLGLGGRSLATKQFGPKILRLGDMIKTLLLGSYLLSLLNTALYLKIWPVYGFLMSWRDKLGDVVL